MGYLLATGWVARCLAQKGPLSAHFFDRSAAMSCKNPLRLAKNGLFFVSDTALASYNYASYPPRQRAPQTVAILPIMTDSTGIAQTSHWINTVVIGCNFCPFAAKSMLRKSVRCVVIQNATLKSALSSVEDELRYLDQTADIETTLLIFPGQFSDFSDYLDLVEMAEDVTVEQGYEGIYQLASFHPAYCFDGATDDDPANYTNRSPYPMLHLLREDSITKALRHFIDPEGIPARNIAFAQEKGMVYMQSLRAACFDVLGK